MRRHGIAVTIPERADQAANRLRRGARGGRPPAFDIEAYKHRNVVERCFNRLKQFRAVATRCERFADRYRAGLHLAAHPLAPRTSRVIICQTGPSAPGATRYHKWA